MKEIKLKDSVSGNEILLEVPTKLNEITKDWLLDVTRSVIPAPYYSLVACVSKDTLVALLNTNKKKNDKVVGVVPLFIKTATDTVSFTSNVSDEFAQNIDAATPIIIAPSDLSMGHHINVIDNKYSPSYVYNICQLDKNSYQQALNDMSNIYLVEFKLVPNSAIHGKYVTENTNKEN